VTDVRLKVLEDEAIEEVQEEIQDLRDVQKVVQYLTDQGVQDEEIK
jgi:hypothetical protein